MKKNKKKVKKDLFFNLEYTYENRALILLTFRQAPNFVKSRELAYRTSRPILMGGVGGSSFNFSRFFRDTFCRPLRVVKCKFRV